MHAVPVLEGFDAIRNCSHCRENTDDDCAAWRKPRKAVVVLRQECRRYAKGVDELLGATGGPATIYEFAGGSVAYFAPDAPDFAEAGELKDGELAAARRTLDERGMPCGIDRMIPDPGTRSGPQGASIPERSGRNMSASKLSLLR